MPTTLLSKIKVTQDFSDRVIQKAIADDLQNLSDSTSSDVSSLTTTTTSLGTRITTAETDIENNKCLAVAMALVL